VGETWCLYYPHSPNARVAVALEVTKFFLSAGKLNGS